MLLLFSSKYHGNLEILTLLHLTSFFFCLQATGQQPGEELLPDDDPTPEVKEAPQPFHPDEAVLYQLVDMGFSRNGCTRALYETKNSGVEAAMNWVMEHMGDANFNDPFVDPK